MGLSPSVTMSALKGRSLQQPLRLELELYARMLGIAGAICATAKHRGVVNSWFSEHISLYETVAKNGADSSRLVRRLDGHRFIDRRR